jgi:hypothetical protein
MKISITKKKFSKEESLKRLSRGPGGGILELDTP